MDAIGYYYPVIVLALDSTLAGGSCALAYDGRARAEQQGDETRTQAARLPGDLMALLERERLSLSDVDAFAVGIGPGSFTGLRVGIATMQALAFADRKPLVGVSGLDALSVLGARQIEAGTVSDRRHRIVAWIDAWRGEVYAAVYEHGAPIEPAVVAAPDALLAGLPRGPALFIGDGAARHAGLIRREAGDEAAFASPAAPPLAGVMAEMATTVLLSGRRPSPDAIRPLYVRRSDAELARDARAGR
jgi:tRNA threonylcarbamoyladenosine biosynthesis protein TsaB